MPRTPEQDRIYLKAYRAANREKVRAQARARMRRWAAAHPEKVAAKNSAYYEANKDKQKARNKARYHQDPERSRAYFRAWRQANPGKSLAAVKAWIAKHPEYKRAVNAARHARKAGLQREHIDFSVLIVRQKSLCPWCGKTLRLSDASLDHIVPVALGAQGGSSHTYANVQLLHKRCNSSKGKGYGLGVQPYLSL